MRSRADAPAFGRAVEIALRVIALVLLAWLLARALRPASGIAAGAVHRADATALARSLQRWSRDVRATRVDVALDSLPAASQRDWLAALRTAGVAVTWRAGAARPAAMALEPVRAPGGGVGARIAAPASARVLLRDDVGVLDSALISVAGAAIALPEVVGAVRAALPGATAIVRGADFTRPIGRVLVAGRAGWEGKFVVTALEEAGWQVDAALRLSPTLTVRQGPAAPIDTARYAALVLLDSTTVNLAAAATRYAVSGGGVVLLPDAARAPAFAALRPARPGESRPGVAGALSTADPRRALPLSALAALPADAIVLERRGDAIAAAARRVRAGRVVVLGYDDTWRWRMEGGADAVVAHRSWWSSIVAGVAFAATAPLDTAGLQHDDGAPWAATVAALGPPTPASVAAAGLERGLDVSSAALAVALLGALLLEWALRRQRGVP